MLFSLQIGSHTTPLQLACRNNRGDTVDVLVGHGVDTDQFSGVSQLGK